MMPVTPLDIRLSAMPPMSRFFYTRKTHEGCEFFIFLDTALTNQTYFLENGYAS